MTHSVSRRVQVACPECGATFEAPVWEILDGQERPDLLALAYKGTLNNTVCPDGHPNRPDVALLLFRPDAPNVLIISYNDNPAPSVDVIAEEARLVAELESRLAPELRHHLEDGRIVWLPPDLLSLVEPDEDGEYGGEAVSASDPEFLQSFGDIFAPEALEAMNEISRMHPDVFQVMSEIARATIAAGGAIFDDDALERTLEANPDLRARLEAAERKAIDEGWGNPYGDSAGAPT